MKRSLAILSILTVLTAAARAQEEALPTVPAADAAAVQKINQLGGGAMPVAANTQALSVNFSLGGTKIDDAALESIKGVADQVVWLNLGGTGITDAGLKALVGLKNLRRLHLERTAVGDAGLENLKGLGELQYLNLYSTKVTDAAAAALGGLKKLKSLYLWQTSVTEAGAAALAKALPGCYINRGIDPPAKIVEIAKPEGPKAINAKCPVLGKDVDGAITFTYENQLIAFCCKDCCGKFAKEPAKFIEKVENFKKAEKKAETKAPASVKEVMAAANKGKDSLFGKVSGGKGSDEEHKKLAEFYKLLAGFKPPQGDEAAFKIKTAALAAASQEVADKKEGGLEKLKAAGNCKACHEVFKPK